MCTDYVAPIQKMAQTASTTQSMAPARYRSPNIATVGHTHARTHLYRSVNNTQRGLWNMHLGSSDWTACGLWGWWQQKQDCGWDSRIKR